MNTINKNFKRILTVVFSTVLMISLLSTTVSAASVKAPAIKSVATKSSSSVTVKWKKVSSASGYVVYQKKDNGKYKKVATIKSGSKVSYTKSGLSSATKYSYKVKAYKTKSNNKTYSSYSKVKAAYTKPATPKITTAKAVSATSVNLKWGKISKSDGYVVYIKSGSKYKRVATIKSEKTTSYTVKGLNSNKKYTFAVKSYFTPDNKSIYSAYSKTKSATTKSAVTSTSSVQGSSSRDKVWIPTKGGTKYHVAESSCNMVGPIQVTESEAINQGFGRCKRCRW